jgi:hypothetical protein
VLLPVARRVHADQRRVVRVPGRFAALGAGRADDLHGGRVRDGDVVGPQAHDVAPGFVLAEEFLVRFEVRGDVLRDVVEGREPCGEGAGEAVERVEEEAVGEEAGVEGEEVEGRVGGGGEEGGPQGQGGVLDLGDEGDEEGKDVGLQDGEDVQVLLAVVELRRGLG